MGERDEDQCDNDGEGDSRSGKKYGRRSEDAMEINGPFGIKLRANGRNASVIGMLLACTAGMGYMIYVHGSEIKEPLARIEDKQVQMQQGLEEMVYVMSLTDDERKRLNLSMPATLRRKIHERDEYERGARNERLH